MSASSQFVRFRTAFFTGLVLLAPLAVTTIVFVWLVSQVGGSFRSFVFEWIPESLQRFALLWDLLFTGIVVGFIAALGVLSRWVLGRYFGGVTERFIQGIPGIGALYSLVKQIVQTFSGENRAAFSRVVLVPFPHPGSYGIGFVTNSSGGEASTRLEKELSFVFLPTTPNPTSGFLLLVPPAALVDLEMTITEAMKLIVSGGSILPPWPAAAPVTVANPPAPGPQPLPPS